MASRDHSEGECLRTRGRETDSQLSGKFCLSAGHEGCGLFLANLDEPYFVLMSAKGLHDSIDAVARKSKDDFSPQSIKHSISTSAAVSTPHPEAGVIFSFALARDASWTGLDGLKIKPQWEWRIPMQRHRILTIGQARKGGCRTKSHDR